MEAVVSNPAEVITKTSWWIRERDLRWEGREEEERMSFMIVWVWVVSGVLEVEVEVGFSEEVLARWASMICLVSWRVTCGSGIIWC